MMVFLGSYAQPFFLQTWVDFLPWSSIFVSSDQSIMYQVDYAFRWTSPYFLLWSVKCDRRWMQHCLLSVLCVTVVPAAFILSCDSFFSLTFLIVNKGACGKILHGALVWWDVQLWVHELLCNWSQCMPGGLTLGLSCGQVKFKGRNTRKYKVQAWPYS